MASIKTDPQALKLTELLKEAGRRRASDLHLIAGVPPVLRIDGELYSMSNTPLSAEEARSLSYSLLTPGQVKRFEHAKELDFGYSMKGSWRFRMNLRWQQRQVSLTARLIPTVVPKPVDIGVTETMYGLTHLMDGLILVTGPAGAGKSTTLASMIDIINTERSAHIITIEDPIEFLHPAKKSIIEQREVFVDTRSYADAVKFSLRQDPDVLLVGEMRDLETMQAVLTAAETGHLVLSTLHTRSAAESIDRIVDVFPPHQQNQIRIQLASVLRATISQVLLPGRRGGRIAAREIMIVNHAISNLIRQNDISQVYSHIQMGSAQGMCTMNMAVEELRKQGEIGDITARNRTSQEFTNHRFF